MRFFRKIIFIFLTILSVFTFISCDEESDKLIVGVTIIPQSTFVKKVCGDLVDVVTIVPTGSSPETFEPKPKDMIKLNKAIAYFTIGVPTEKTNVLSNLTNDTKIVYLEEKCQEVYDDVLFSTGGRDPHIWLSPKRVIIMVEAIRDEMMTLDPLNSSTYRQNAKLYIEELKSLDSKIKSAVEKTETKDFIAFHPAFGYLAADYGLTMHALEEDGKEATIEHLTKMIDFAKEKGIKVIFYQEEIDSSQSQTFADEIEGVAVKLEPLSADYTDNLLNMAKTIASLKYE